MLSESKDELRNIFRQKRAAITEKQRKAKDREIVKNFYTNISLQKKSIISAYIANGSEVDIDLLLEMYIEDGHKICLPCIEEKNAPMTFREYTRGAKLTKNPLTNTFEPPANFKEVIPNVIITPLIAFDSSGTRLGMGAGYYDRTLEYLSGFAEFITLGVAYACQQAQYIKREPTDFKLDSLVTEEKVFVF